MAVQIVNNENILRGYWVNRLQKGHPKTNSNEVEELYIRQNGVCLDCGKPLEGYWADGGYEYNPTFIFKHLDSITHHIIPHYYGGIHRFCNLVLICQKPCHYARHYEIEKLSRQLHIPMLSEELFPTIFNLSISELESYIIIAPHLINFIKFVNGYK